MNIQPASFLEKAHAEFSTVAWNGLDALRWQSPDSMPTHLHWRRARRGRQVAGRFAGGVASAVQIRWGTLYIDNQGTQGFLYTPGQNFESYNFRNPTTGQAWSGAVMTFGPQLSIGLIQGANQVGTATVLPGPPRERPRCLRLSPGYLNNELP